MARIYPFRAWRYSPSAVRLQDVVTQPYDKISPAMQQAYYERSPYNLVRIILGLPELFDAERGESFRPVAKYIPSAFDEDQKSHLLDGFDAERFQTLFQHARRQIAQRQPACARGGIIGFQHRAIFVKRGELAREFEKIIAEVVWP